MYTVSIVLFGLGLGEDYVYHRITEFTGLHKKDGLKLNEKQQEMYMAKKLRDDLLRVTVVKHQRRYPDHGRVRQ